MFNLEKFLFKKIEVWIVLLLIIIFLIFTFAFGVIVHQGLKNRVSLGNISIKFLTDPVIRIVSLPDKLLVKILKPNAARIGDFWDKKREFLKEPGFKGQNNLGNYYLLLSRYSIESEQSVIELIDLKNFKIIHKWEPDIDEFNEKILTEGQFKNHLRDKNKKQFIITHPYLSKSAEVVFSNYSQLIKIDKCSKLIWQNQKHVFHHSKESNDNGDYWVPIKLYESKIKNYEKVGNHDALSLVSKNGKIIFEKSLYELFLENNLEHYIQNHITNTSNRRNSDVFHLNDIEPTRFDSKYWKKGDVFLSLRNLSMIILYRPSTNKLIKVLHGPFFNQHDVDVLNDHEISIFNNNYRDFGTLNSEIIKYNFKTGEFTTYFKNSMIENNVFTEFQGVHKILPTGELFLESTTDGRILFFDNKGRLTWQFVNNENDKKELYALGWSRILHTDNDLKKIKKLRESKCQ